MKPSITSRNLAIFSLLAVAIGWIGIWLDGQIPDQEEEETVGMALWLVSPLIVVIILRTFFGDGWKDAGLRPNFSKNVHWYTIAFLIFPVVTIGSMSLGGALGWVDFSGFDTGSYLSLLGTLFLVNIVKNIFALTVIVVQAHQAWADEVIISTLKSIEDNHINSDKPYLLIS